jgi:prophage regulatory protein
MTIPRRFLRLRAVRDFTGLPTSTIYDEMSRGRFPRPIPLGPRCVAWDAQEVADWQEARIAARNEPAITRTHKKNAATEPSGAAPK